MNVNYVNYDVYHLVFLSEFWFWHVPHKTQYGDRNRTGGLQRKQGKYGVSQLYEPELAINNETERNKLN